MAVFLLYLIDLLLLTVNGDELLAKSSTTGKTKRRKLNHHRKLIDSDTKKSLPPSCLNNSCTGVGISQVTKAGPCEASILHNYCDVAFRTAQYKASQSCRTQSFLMYIGNIDPSSNCQCQGGLSSDICSMNESSFNNNYGTSISCTYTIDRVYTGTCQSTTGPNNFCSDSSCFGHVSMIQENVPSDQCWKNSTNIHTLCTLATERVKQQADVMCNSNAKCSCQGTLSLATCNFSMDVNNRECTLWAEYMYDGQCAIQSVVSPFH